MTKNVTPLPDRLGVLCADLLRERLDAQVFRTSNRHIIDYLPDDVGERLFDALLERADRHVSVRVEQDDGSWRPQQLRAFSDTTDSYDLIPFLVDPTASTNTAALDRANRGTEGFASYLRDGYAVDAERPRLLLVITPSGIETQKSAQDLLADEALITLERVLQQVLDERGASSQSHLRAVAKAYHHHQPADVPWTKAVDTFDRYVEEVADKEPKEQGRRLPMLGCFLPDASDDFASGGRVSVLEDHEERRRKRGEGRLYDNGLLRGYLTDAFANPLEQPEHFLTGLFDEPAKAAQIAQRGMKGLDDLDLSIFTGMDRVRRKRSKNAFDLSQIVIKGAAHHHVLSHSGGGLIVVTAPSAFSITLAIQDPFQPRREYAQLMRWGAARRKPSFDVLDVPDGAKSLTFEIPAMGEEVKFFVCRLALTKGRRTRVNPMHEVLVVVYVDDTPEVVIEERRRIDFESQAWTTEREVHFFRYTADGSEPIEFEREDSEDAPAPESDTSRISFRARLSGSPLRPLVIEDTPDEAEYEEDTGSFGTEKMLELCATTAGPKYGYRTTEAMKRTAHYLDSIVEIIEGSNVYEVDLGGVTRKVYSSRYETKEPFLWELAAGRLLHSPTTWRVERRGAQWQDVSVTPAEAAERFFAIREHLLRKLRDLAAEKLPHVTRSTEATRIPITLLPLHRLRLEIEELLAAWTEAVDRLGDIEGQYDAPHEQLLQTDTLQIYESDRLTRLVVLPTHPWLLNALLAYQTVFGQNIEKAAKRGKGGPRWYFELERHEVEQLVPRTALEEWYIRRAGEKRLRLADGAPFHLEFVPEVVRGQSVSLEYVARIVANKIARYLRMHPHLRNRRRTLRIGFVNAGDAKHLLDGLRFWLQDLLREREDRLRILDPDQIPSIDLYLFSTKGKLGVDGSALERFFNEQVAASDENVVQQTLLARLRYRFCADVEGPSSDATAVHICFVQGIVDTNNQSGKTGKLDDWWDGGFAAGLLSTYLRRTVGSVGSHRQSRRGLWIDPRSTGTRGALAKLLSLQRGCRDGDFSTQKALYWECELPRISALTGLYEHSDWVVHLDRELTLDLFREESGKDIPTIIEYSDQEVPSVPGYDTITATRFAKPYKEQLGEILTTAELDIRNREEEARRAAHDLLDDINALSGSWALDFLHGSIADNRMSMRLKGNVGSALAFRWLKRVEKDASGGSRIETAVGLAVPVFVSLEDLLRATPAAGLTPKDGLVHRFTNEVEDETAKNWCDDLLVLYLTETKPGEPSRLYGRVIEVKFGVTARQAKTKAAAQVKETFKLLQEHLSGGAERIDAPFRNKQLSLLLKAQLEQATAMGLLGEDVYDSLNIPALSANLATGNYRVDYTIGHDGQHLKGDAFLLSTAESNNAGSNDEDRPQIELYEGVRVITLSRRLVEWLAFQLDDSPTLRARPVSTLPRLGHYQTVQTSTGRSDRHDRSTESVPPAVPTSGTTTAEPDPSRVHEDAPQAEDRSHLRVQDSQPHLQWDSSEPPTKTGGEPATARRIDDAQPTPVEESTPSALPDKSGSVGMTLSEAVGVPVKDAPYPDAQILDVVGRLEQALVGHKVRLSSTPSPRETDRGPRLVRAYIRLEAGESINSVRRISEDIARVVGTTTSDIHITNVPERHAVGLDLPIPGLTYAISFDELHAHPSFEAARAAMTLGFCAGIDVTGRAVWADLADMPHMLVAGTTGSGKTVFLRNVILTLLLASRPNELVLRLSSSKPMDFRIFTRVRHVEGREMARDPSEALALAQELVQEMDRRIAVITDAWCDNLGEFNTEHPGRAMPRIVAVFDEYAEMIASSTDKAERDAFESAIGRLAQKARAAGIHLIVCMQRPDANALKGAIKANILHRFALKLPQNHDSRIILDESGAETLLGQGDLLYKDANSRVVRLQVPFLDNASLKRHLQGLE